MVEILRIPGSDLPVPTRPSVAKFLRHGKPFLCGNGSFNESVTVLQGSVRTNKSAKAPLFCLVIPRGALYNEGMAWNDRLMTLFREATERYLVNPHTGADRFFLPDEAEFLPTIGLRPEDLYHLIADYATLGEPSPSAALLIIAQRRSFFLTTQRGISGTATEVKAAALPAETEEFQEIPYLPRIIRKAEAMLFGTLDKSLMFPDAKDRDFLHTHGDIHPADFLQLVSSARGDRQKIVTAVLNAIHSAATSSTASGHADNVPTEH